MFVFTVVIDTWSVHFGIAKCARQNTTGACSRDHWTALQRGKHMLTDVTLVTHSYFWSGSWGVTRVPWCLSTMSSTQSVITKLRQSRTTWPAMKERSQWTQTGGGQARTLKQPSQIHTRTEKAKLCLWWLETWRNSAETWAPCRTPHSRFRKLHEKLQTAPGWAELWIWDCRINDAQTWR